MRRIVILSLFTIFVISCGTSKHVSVKQPKKKIEKYNSSEGNRWLKSSFSGKNTKSVINILKDAEKYLGSPYKFGGNDKNGFDCSGLMCKVFKENDIMLPRNSKSQSEQGKNISIEASRPGDLLFFATSGGNRVSHVGIVHTVSSTGEITFLHASTSKGVIISSLEEKYWNRAFLFAKRLITS